MSKIPSWAEGSIFAALLVILIFFLKVLCPVDIGCFADPFLIPLFSPLFILKIFSISLGSFEPFFILFFWTVCGGLGGYFAGNLKIKNKNKLEITS